MDKEDKDIKEIRNDCSHYEDTTRLGIKCPAADDDVVRRLKDLSSYKPTSKSEAWQSLTSDPWVISPVSRGLKIEFVHTPIQLARPPRVRMASEQEAVCGGEVKSLLEKGSIFEARYDTPGFLSSMFAVPKKSGGGFR